MTGGDNSFILMVKVKKILESVSSKSIFLTSMTADTPYSTHLCLNKPTINRTFHTIYIFFPTNSGLYWDENANFNRKKGKKLKKETYNNEIRI